MTFDPSKCVRELRAALPDFESLAGAKRWAKRTALLQREMEASPFRAKMIGDFHWLELELADQMHVGRGDALPSPQIVSSDTLAAMYFAQTTVAVHKRLPRKAKTVLEGRIRDALKADTGFSSVYLEMDMARCLLDAGYEVHFPDLDGTGQYDLLFRRGAVESEVECKSLSCDAGRKIHRKDFYRFVDALGPTISRRIEAEAREIVVVTLDDRLPAGEKAQQELRRAAIAVLITGDAERIDGSFFSVIREVAVPRLGATLPADPSALHKRCRTAYGDACHVSGGMTSNACCLVVVRSCREDDHSAPQLEAAKKATTQFSGNRPAFIVVQYDDIRSEDLLLPDLRRRAGLLSYYLFMEKDAGHVAGIQFRGYGGLSVSHHAIGIPAFGVRNPRLRFHIRPEDYPRFLENIPHQEFANLVGADSGDRAT